MKQCKKDGCYQNVFSHDFCRNHQYLRTDLKKKKNKISVININKSIHDFSFGFDSQVSLFIWCWQNSLNKHNKVICKYTGEELNKYYGTDMYYQCFAHRLPKGRYTYFKYNPLNIAVVSPAFHKIIDQGTLLDRINHQLWRFDIWDKEAEEMKIQYQLFKEQNQLS